MAEQQVSTNKFATAKWIVDTNGLDKGATHTTIAGALSSASSGEVIFIKPGTYTEDLTLKAGVNLTAESAGSSSSKVTIVGKLTANFAANGSAALSNIKLQTNGDNCIVFSGLNTNYLSFRNCVVNANDNDAISYTNSAGSSILTFDQCTLDPSATYKMFVASQSGFMNCRYCHMSNGGGSTAASTISSGTLRLDYTEVRWPITSSGTSTLQMTHAFFNNMNNTTALTVGGSGTNFVKESCFSTGSASSISVSSNLNITNCDINSTNTNAITGAGTVNYGGIEYGNTGIENNATTQAGFYSDIGKYRARHQPCFNAYLSSSANNQTGDGTAYTIVFNAERFDQGSDFDTSTGVFTAPIDGKYELFATVRLLGLTASHTRSILTIETSNWNYEFNAISAAARDSNNHLEIQGSFIVDMDAGDTASIKVATSGGTKVVDVGGNGTLTISGFSGMLVS